MTKPPLSSFVGTSKPALSSFATPDPNTDPHGFIQSQLQTPAPKENNFLDGVSSVGSFIGNFIIILQICAIHSNQHRTKDWLWRRKTCRIFYSWWC